MGEKKGEKKSNSTSKRNGLLFGAHLKKINKYLKNNIYLLILS